MAKDNKAPDPARVLKWNEYSVQFDSLPTETLFALAARGFNHILGNEVAAYETGLKAKESERKDAKGNPLKAYSATEIAVMVHDRREEKIAEMAAGTLGYRAAGPRLTSDEKALWDIAKDNLVAAFHKANLTKDMPKASNVKAWDALVEQYLGNAKTRAVADAELARRKESLSNVVGDDELADMLAGLKAA